MADVRWRLGPLCLSFSLSLSLSFFLAPFLLRQRSWIKIVHCVLNLSFRVHFPSGDSGHVHEVSSTCQRADELPLKGQTQLADWKDIRGERREVLKQTASTLAILS